MMRQDFHTNYINFESFRFSQTRNFIAGASFFNKVNFDSKLEWRDFLQDLWIERVSSYS